MTAYIIYDKEFRTDTFTKLYKSTKDYLISKGYEVTETGIGRGDLAYCIGCFGCWVKSPGECAIPDLMKEINYTFMNSDVVIYLSPIVFGQFSANIKNAMDRWIPNVLPFFKLNKDGSTYHPKRYASYPKQAILGYADHISEEDSKLFTDITAKHRKSIEVFIYRNDDIALWESLDKINLKRVGGEY